MGYYRLVFRIVRCWRCYILLIIATILSIFLIYLGQYDPKLEYLIGSSYYDIISSSNPDVVKRLMTKNDLDYDYLNVNSKFCLSTNTNKKSALYDWKFANINEDFNLLNEDGDYFSNDPKVMSNLKSSENTEFDFIFLIISEAENFRHRHAIRHSWAKQLDPKRVKFVFFVGNPELNINKTTTKFTENKLKLEIEKSKDIVQINMHDDKNYTSTKTLLAIRWSITYCLLAKNLFIISDSSVLNVKYFSQSLLKANKDKKFILDDYTIAGNCNLKDDNLAKSLKKFFASILYKYKQGIKEENPTIKLLVKRSAKTTKSSYDSNNLTTVTTELNKITKISNDAKKIYDGEYCSNLGWMISNDGAKRLWLTAQKTPYIMKLSPAYLSGFLAFKANLSHTDWFAYQNTVPFHSNCIEVFEKDPKKLVCAEDFTIESRYSNYISTWNSPTQFDMFKL